MTVAELEQLRRWRALARATLNRQNLEANNARQSSKATEEDGTANQPASRNNIRPEPTDGNDTHGPMSEEGC